eukprot:CAMPEP_0171254976 /NCGR_PEP_ID=MMETSP0790-20130122/52517_1 /TAXON_ID=2925 /ORGANISM="Alexandrium catenella, Strain OF101" /LENGTH=230 /DNA_ID=CAMNT_0011722891 /DNA_START=65 /DNA_END=754 /DNA_ORIENTATION=+
MTERELASAVTIIPDRLYWVALQSVPKNTARTHYFCIDNALLYEAFFADFGPLNLGMVYHYCKILEAKLTDPALEGKRIVHYCAHDPKKRANAACLMCLYQVAKMHRSAEQSYEPFSAASPAFLPFRDASCSPTSFPITILDCCRGLAMSIRLRWFDVNRFDIKSYEFFQKVENGDMNWIIPSRFLAFAGPFSDSTDEDGYPVFTPENYVPVFRRAQIGLVVRLNKKQYD